MNLPENVKWKQQIFESIKSIEKLKEEDIILEDETEIEKLPLRVTKYYLSVAKNNKQLLKTIIPSKSELIISEGESNDPLNEEEHKKTKCIVHKYPDRVLFLSTKFCSTNCRFCTRSRLVGGEELIYKKDWIEGIEYIKQHKEIRDVLISGGDPLTLSDSSLFFILSELRKIDHVEIIRIGTKIPVVLPDRITDELINILKQFHPLFINIHFTHPDEITDQVKIACNKLADAGIPLGSQTVLLKDINDNIFTIKKLMHELLKVRVRPYYLYHLDPIIGSAHFKSTIEKGLEIINSLRGFTSGFAVPAFIVDTKIGKIAISDSNIKIKDDKIILENYDKKQIKFDW